MPVLPEDLERRDQPLKRLTNHHPTKGKQTMTIDELIQRLEEYRDDLGGDVAVRLMTQQNWPFENEIIGLTSGEEIRDAADDEEPNDKEEDADEDQVVFIVEGQQRCYGTKRAWVTAY